MNFSYAGKICRFHPYTVFDNGDMQTHVDVAIASYMD